MLQERRGENETILTCDPAAPSYRCAAQAVSYSLGHMRSYDMTILPFTGEEASIHRQHACIITFISTPTHPVLESTRLLEDLSLEQQGVTRNDVEGGACQHLCAGPVAHDACMHACMRVCRYALHASCSTVQHEQLLVICTASCWHGGGCHVVHVMVSGSSCSCPCTSCHNTTSEHLRTGVWWTRSLIRAAAACTEASEAAKRAGSACSVPIRLVDLLCWFTMYTTEHGAQPSWQNT